MNFTRLPQLNGRPRRRILLYGAVLIINMLIFSWTSPLESPAWVVIAGFVVVAVDVVLVTRLFVRFLGLLVPKLTPYRRKITVALASFGIVALALASLGQLTGRDLIVVLVIWVLGYLYSLRFHLGAPRT